MEATDRFSPNQPEETPQTKNYMDNDPEHSHIRAYVVAWILLPPLFPTTTSCANGRCAIDNPAWNVLVIIGAFLTIGLLIFSVITLRRFKWIADNETATLFGRDQLITSLRRVSEVSPSDDWNVQRRIGKLSRPDQTTT